MKEIGGYFELDEYEGEEYYEDAVALNCGRNAIAFCIKSNRYKKIYVPNFSCDAVVEGVEKGGAICTRYDIDENFFPLFSSKLDKDEAIIIINYYGLISNDKLKDYKDKFKNIIVDNTQAFFQRPLYETDTIYSCRKFFGVADGAYLFTTAQCDKELERDFSVDRMRFVLGRFDKDASSFYNLARENNESFKDAPILAMSRLTHNLLRALNYEKIKRKREENYLFLHNALKNINYLNLTPPIGGWGYYPLYLKENADKIRKYMREKKIYVPCLWPENLINEKEDSTAYNFAKNILPLPVDQRYDLNDMKYMLNVLNKALKVYSKRR